MRAPSRRVLLQGAFAAVGAVLARAGLAQAAGEPRIIEMTARRFVYEPSEIALKAGERVVVAIRSGQRSQGLQCAALGRWLDAVLGRV